MSGVNKAIILGRAGKDAEVKHIQSGSSVASFSLAVSEMWKDKTTGEKKETVEWINFVAWNALADIAGKYIKKGDNVYVEGKLKTRSWEKDGITRYTTEVQVSNIVLLGSKRQESAPPPSSFDQAFEMPTGSPPTPKTVVAVAKPQMTAQELNDATSDLPF